MPNMSFGSGSLPVFNPAYAGMPQGGLVNSSFQQAPQAQTVSAPSTIANTGLINTTMQAPQQPGSATSAGQLQDQRQLDQQYLSSVDASRQGASQFPVFNPFYTNRS